MATLGVVFGLHWIIPNGRSAPGNSPMAPGLTAPAPVPASGLTKLLGLPTNTVTCVAPSAATTTGPATVSPATRTTQASPAVRIPPIPRRIGMVPLQGDGSGVCLTAPEPQRVPGQVSSRGNPLISGSGFV